MSPSAQTGTVEVWTRIYEFRSPNASVLEYG